MSRCTNQKGFSMIELLVALSILIIGTLAVASMLMRSSENSVFANHARGSDITAIELVEGLKGEIVQTTFDELEAKRLEKLIGGSTTRYAYQDAFSVETGTVGTGRYVQRQGVGQGCIYKWRVENRKSDYELPKGTLKLEVTVGWNDKKYIGKYTCSGDPDTCARRSKMTNWIIQPQ